MKMESPKRYILCVLMLGFSLHIFAQEPFVTIWKTDVNGTIIRPTITIPIHPDANLEYEYDIDWEGDGIYDEKNVTTSISHTYSAHGTYQVAIRGKFPSIYFNNGGDKDKILEIAQWGDIVWGNLNSAFEGCSNLILTARDEPDLGIVSSISEMFLGATSVVSGFSNWDVSNVEYMVSTFNNASNFNGDLSSWDVSNCNSIRFMFNGATSFNQDISCWNVGQMSDFRFTFSGASSFDQSLAKWDMSGAVNLSSFLSNSGMSRSNYDKTLIGWANSGNINSGISLGADGLEYCNAYHARQLLLDAPFNWIINDTGENCNQALFITTWKPDSTSTPPFSFTIPTHPNKNYNYDIDINNDGTFENTSVSGDVQLILADDTEVTIAIRGEFPHFFLNRSTDRNRIISLDQWGEIKWTSMDSAFWRAEKMKYNASDAPDLQNVESMKKAFSSCDLFQGDLNSWDVSNVINMEEIFRSSDSLDIDISAWNVVNVTNLRSAFANTRIFSSDLSEWRVDNVTDMGSMFENASLFNSDLSLWNVSQVTNMSRMFRDTDSFTSDLNNWDVSNVEFISGMFWSAREFDSDLDLWGPKLTKITSTSNMFQAAVKFNGQVDNWNLRNVLRMNSMFAGANSFNQDLSTWTTSNVEEMENMFQGADSFDQDLGDMDISDVEDMNFIFSNSGMSRINYDSTLIKWANQSVRYNVRIGAIGVNYCESLAARDTLDIKYRWTFQGDIYDCNQLTCTEITNTKYGGLGLGEWYDSPNRNWDKRVVPDSCHRVVLLRRTLIPEDYDADCYTLDVHTFSWGFTVESGGTLTVHANEHN